MKEKKLHRFCAATILGLSLAPPSQAEFLDGVQEIVVSAPVSRSEEVNICYAKVAKITRCDYRQASLSEMTVPFKGQIIYTRRIVANAESRATFYVTNQENDCTLRLKNETFMRNTSIIGNGNTLSFDVSQALLGDGMSCFKNGDVMYIVTDITVSVENDMGGTTLVQVKISNDAAAIPSTNSFQLQQTVIKTNTQ
jgi:hypothetical protein